MSSDVDMIRECDAETIATARETLTQLSGDRLQLLKSLYDASMHDRQQEINGNGAKEGSTVEEMAVRNKEIIRSEILSNLNRIFSESTSLPLSKLENIFNDSILKLNSLGYDLSTINNEGIIVEAEKVLTAKKVVMAESVLDRVLEEFGHVLEDVACENIETAIAKAATRNVSHTKLEIARAGLAVLRQRLKEKRNGEVELQVAIASRDLETIESAIAAHRSLEGSSTSSYSEMLRAMRFAYELRQEKAMQDLQELLSMNHSPYSSDIGIERLVETTKDTAEVNTVLSRLEKVKQAGLKSPDLERAWKLVEMKKRELAEEELQYCLDNSTVYNFVELSNAIRKAELTGLNEVKLAAAKRKLHLLRSQRVQLDDYLQQLVVATENRSLLDLEELLSQDRWSSIIFNNNSKNDQLIVTNARDALVELQKEHKNQLEESITQSSQQWGNVEIINAEQKKLLSTLANALNDQEGPSLVYLERLLEECSALGIGVETLPQTLPQKGSENDGEVADSSLEVVKEAKIMVKKLRGKFLEDSLDSALEKCSLSPDHG